MQSGEPPAPTRWRLAREVLPLAVVILVGLKASHEEWRTSDLTWSDETLYLSLAWHISDPVAVATKHPMYAPLYVGWYRFLLQLPVEPEYLPYLNHAALMGLLGCLFYAITRRLGVSRWAGAAAVAVVIHGMKLAEVEPFPVHMATVVFALGVWLATFRRSLLGACGPVGFAALAACYARNEFGTFLLMFLPCYLGVGAWALWRGAECRREFLPWAVPLLLTVGVCAVTLGVPMPDGPRGVFAFSQHYARNVVEAKSGDPMDWVVHHERTTQADFGEVKTLGEAVRARPDAFAWHVGRNLQRLPEVTIQLCRPRTPFKPAYQTAARLFLWGVLGTGLVCFLCGLGAGRLRASDAHSLRVVLFALACTAVVSGPSVLVVYPRDHYLILPLFFVLALAVSGLPAPRWPSGWLGEPARGKLRAAGFLVAALLLGGMPTATDKRTFLRPVVSQFRPLPPPTGRETMALLRQLPRRPGTVVMDRQYTSTITTLWMARPVTWVPHDRKADGFYAFVAQYGLEVIILEPELLRDPSYATDPEFQALWNETDIGPFVVLAYGRARIAVRRDLVPPR